MTSIYEKAVLDLSATLADITDYNDLPDCLQETISKYLHFDWLGLFSAPARGEIYSVTSNPHLPFNWDELYQEIAPYDNYREKVLSLPPPMTQPLTRHVTPEGQFELGTGPWSFRIKAKQGSIACHDIYKPSLLE